MASQLLWSGAGVYVYFVYPLGTILEQNLFLVCWEFLLYTLIRDRNKGDWGNKIVLGW